MASKREVLEVLFPVVRAKLLRVLLPAPQRPHYVRQLVNVTGLSLHTVQDELRKLTAIGLLMNWSNGYHRFYRANRDHPLFSHVLGLVQRSAQLSATPHSALRRPRGGRVQSKRVRKRRNHFPPNRPPAWGIFRGEKRT